LNTQPAVPGSFSDADFMDRSRDFTEILPWTRKTPPPPEWDKDDFVAAKRAYNTRAAHRCCARKTDQEEDMRRRIKYLERQLKSSQEWENFWKERAQNRDESSAPSTSTTQSKQDNSSPSKVSKKISIASLLIKNTSIGACEPRGSSQAKLFKCPNPGYKAAPFGAKSRLQ
jgi:hypothetical protein